MSLLFKHKINWQYAIGEVILIFIGITLAIAFNNWNEDRQQKRRNELEQKTTLLAIFSDLQLDIKSFEHVIDKLDDQYQSGLRILKRNKREITDSLESMSIAKDVNTLLMNVNVNRLENKLDNLKATGNIELIQDQELRRNLFSFYANYDQTEGQFNELPKQARKDYRELMARQNTLEHIVLNYEADLNQDLAGKDVQTVKNWLAVDGNEELIRLIMTTSMVNIRSFHRLIDQAQSIISYMEDTYPDLLGIE